ncbi:hypothetical protein U1Q18_014703 [Sarracenia purpurea var. burkii]
MLWARRLQWDWTLHAGVQFVSKSKLECVLGSVSSVGKGKPDHCATNFDRLDRLHETHESQHHHGLRLQSINVNLATSSIVFLSFFLSLFAVYCKVLPLFFIFFVYKK